VKKNLCYEGMISKNIMDRIIKNRRAKRIGILLAVICLLHIALFSRAFLVSQVNHEHSQHDYSCFVCVTIRLVENLLRLINVTVKGILILPILLPRIMALNENVISLFDKTLVELKVRLDR